MGEYADYEIDKMIDGRWSFKDYPSRRKPSMARSKAKTVVIEGKLVWCQHMFEDNPDEYGGKEFWKTSIILDNDNIQKLKEAGSQARVKYDDGEKSGVEGKMFTFRRDTVLFDKPADPVQITINGEELAEDTPLIGNGSVARLKLEVYKTKSWGNGTRLIAVNVTDLIEYIPPEDEEEEDDQKEDAPKSKTEKSEKKETKKTKKADW